MAYATPEQLATYLGRTGEDIADAARLLARAAEVIAEATLGNIAEPDDPEDIPETEGSETATELLQIACRTACCAQVEYWQEVGEDPDTRPNVSSYQRGRVTTAFSGGGLPELAPRARRILFNAGALYAGGGIA